jgi:large subunit ribosomal protein L35
VTLSGPDASSQRTVEGPCTSTEVPLLPTRPSGRRRPTFYTKGRPAISLDNPRTWNRPLAPGVLPAYDEALKIINRDSAALKKQYEGLRAVLRKLDAGEEVKGDQISGTLKEKLKILEVQSEINLPSVRWTIANGMGESGGFSIQVALFMHK